MNQKLNFRIIQRGCCLKYSAWCALMCLLLPMSACSGKSDSPEKPVLTVSIDPQKKMLEELAGDNFEVVVLLASGANPENYEPTMSQRAATSKSKAYFMVGHLPFEQVIAQSAGANTLVVNTSEGIETITGTHTHATDDSHHHSHSDADPHVWTSLPNGKLMAKNMLNALVEIDPANADSYRERFDRMSHRLDSLNSAVGQRLAQANAHAFAVWHPSLSYFARDYGLHQIAVGQESKELSISTMREIINEAKADSVKVFFFQREYDSRQAQSINSEIGSTLITINPLAYDWEEEIIRTADALAR